VKEGYKRLREMALALPEANRYFLQVLMKLLHQVADPKHAEKNMMKSSNIVIVFDPSCCARRMPPLRHRRLQEHQPDHRLP